MASVTGIAITGASGILNNSLNTGDVVSITVTMSSAVTVSRTPTLNLLIGATSKTATYDATASSGTTLVFTYTISSGDADANGISINAGSVSLTGGASIKDTSTNTNATLTFSAVADNPSYLVDTTVATPTIALATDSGSSSSDGITSNGTVNVAGLESGATWQYSTNNGSSWSTGTGTSFTLAAGNYSANTVHVRQTDLAGNTSVVGKIASAITVDSTAPTTTVSGVHISSDTGASGSDFITNTASQTITGTLSATLGTDKLYGSIDNGVTWTDITTKVSGTTITWSGVTLSGSSTIKLEVRDTAGNTATTLSQAYVLDTSAAAPTIALATDSGSSSSDGITSNGTVNVTGLESGATWQYSSDSGAHWSTGTGSSFTLAPGLHSANTVQVRQTDLAGNTSLAGQTASDITLDTSAAAPTIALATDSGSSSSDGITSNGTVNVTGLESGATWAYSLDSGASWSAGTGSSFTLAPGLHSANTVQVHQTDLAGNTSLAGKTASDISIDTVTPTPSVTIMSGQDSALNRSESGIDLEVSYNGLAEGDIIQLKNGGTDLGGQHTVTAQEVSAGKVAVNLLPSAIGGEGPHSISAVATDLAGNAGTSEALVITVNSAPTGSVTIDGVAKQGETLTASNNIADADGMGSVSYQWYAEGMAIDGTGSASETLLLSKSEVGKTITVKATYTDGHGEAESVASSATAAVLNVNDLPTGSVSIDGVAKQGETLTASNNIADEDGMGTIHYQWYADDEAISGATGSTLLIGDTQINKVITVQASYTDGHGTDESVISNPTDIVLTANEPPMGDVTISGTPTQGQTLTADNNITDADGIPGDISYQWFADGSAIDGATSSTLGLAEAQVGKTITVQASYSDGHGTAESVASSATAAVENVNDAPTGSVTIDGTPTQGETLTAGNTLADIDGLGTIHYQWFADGSAIDGATASTLVLAEAQVGKTITVQASYSDAHGSPESVASDATATVANVNDAPTGNLTITGTPAQGQTLTANNTLADADGIGTLNYQWYANGSAISGATASTLVLGAAQIDKAISVHASYTDLHGHYESVTSAATGLVGSDPYQGTAGNDTIFGSAGDEMIYGYAGHDTLDGGAGNDTLDGGTGDDTLIGGGGNDTLYGGDGIDTADYSGAQAGISVDLSLGTAVSTEGHDEAGTGTDTLSGIENIVSGAYDDILTGNSLANRIEGGDGADTIYGLAGNDILYGGSGSDTLYGGADNDSLFGGEGHDRLEGGAGNDYMAGGTGNDTYVVDSIRDVVFELPNEGIDTVLSSVSYTLGDNVENLTLTGNAAINGTGNALDNIIIGNSANNTLAGGAGNDTLDGGAGNDCMYGGAGNDTYIVDSVSDVVTELASEGTDTVRSSVSYTLGANVEHLTLTGSAAINATGNTLDNIITGNSAANTLNGRAGNDTLDGGAGNDVLIGGAGADTLTGGSGNDIFKYLSESESGTTASTWDVITDFVPGQDQIDLSAIDADSLRAGNQAFTTLNIGSTNTFTAPGQLWYDTAHGILYGNTNSDPSPEFAIQLVGTPHLAAGDIIL